MNIPYIDLISGANLHGDRESAERMLNLFMSQLDQEIEDITLAYQNKDLASMREKVHSLCGAACYSSTPRLLHTLQNINSILASLQDAQTAMKPSDAKLEKSVVVLKEVYQDTVDHFQQMANSGIK
ncbi:MAG: Hpt domain-containing protein [Pseudomonadota bacterium]|nr:Hpt domain-containing protein [Pseudomonadota bacterium]